MQEAMNTTPCMNPDPEDRKVTCGLPRGHNARRHPCSWQRTNRPQSRPALMTVDLSPEPAVATEPGAIRKIPESVPHRGEVPSGITIGQAVTQARTRAVEIKVANFEAELASLRNAATNTAQAHKPARSRSPQQRKVDPRHVFISTMKARGLTYAAIARALDAADDRRLRPRSDWTEDTGLRLWHELWTCGKTYPRTQATVRKYFYVLSAFDSRKHTASYQKRAGKGA